MLNIEQKTLELYEKRIAPYAKAISPAEKESIISFQKLVFEIDQYGENTEKIDSEVLGSFWKKAEEFLTKLGVDESTQTLLLEDLKDYADMESSTRNGKRLSEYEIRLFYFKKSCDVRMQRHLIRFLNKEPVESTEDEIATDILEEIEDDVDDIEEDRVSPFNGNRFLEALDDNDKSKIKEYLDFVDVFVDINPVVVSRLKKKMSLVLS